MAAKFEISTDKSGKFQFHLKAPNGEIITASQGYETKESAHKGIESVKTSARRREGRRPDRAAARAQLARIARSSLARHEYGCVRGWFCARTHCDGTRAR